MSASYPAYQPEAELLPAAASPLNTVAMADSMYRKYGLATPVSGSRTARMHLRYFTRTAQLLMEARFHDQDDCTDCTWNLAGEVVPPCERHS